MRHESPVSAEDVWISAKLQGAPRFPPPQCHELLTVFPRLILNSPNGYGRWSMNWATIRTPKRGRRSHAIKVNAGPAPDSGTLNKPLGVDSKVTFPKYPS